MIGRMLGVSLAALTLVTTSVAQQSATDEATRPPKTTRSGAENTPNDFAEWAHQRLDNQKTERAKRLQILQAKNAEAAGQATKVEPTETPEVSPGTDEGAYQRFAARQREYMHARRKEKAEAQAARLKELERLHEERNQVKEQATSGAVTGDGSKAPAEEPKVISRHQVRAGKPAQEPAKSPAGSTPQD